MNIADVIVIAIEIAILLMCVGIGFCFGCDQTFKRIRCIGTLKIAHDNDGKKYLAIVIDPAHKDVLDNEKDQVQMVFIEHVYPKDSKTFEPTGGAHIKKGFKGK